jgi:dihydrofolate reductase
MICLIAARSKNGVIGKDGKIPWHLSDDLRRFKALTEGRSVIMGRKTWESLPEQPLRGRTNIIVTSNPYRIEAPLQRIYEACGLDCALGIARDAHPGRDIFIIGGQTVYEAALPQAERIYMTEVDIECEGDAFFPEFDMSQWRIVDTNHVPGEIPHTFVTYERKPHES